MLEVTLFLSTRRLQCRPKPGFIEKQRFMGLTERFAWVPEVTLQQLLAAHGYSFQATKSYVHNHYPKQPGYAAASKNKSDSRHRTPAQVPARTKAVGDRVEAGRAGGNLRAEAQRGARPLARSRAAARG